MTLNKVHFVCISEHCYPYIKIYANADLGFYQIAISQDISDDDKNVDDIVLIHDEDNGKVALAKVIEKSTSGFTADDEVFWVEIVEPSSERTLEWFEQYDRSS